MTYPCPAKCIPPNAFSTQRRAPRIPPALLHLEDRLTRLSIAPELGDSIVDWPLKASRQPLLRPSTPPLRGGTAGYYQVYCPLGQDFFCFEPASHPLNAHHLPGHPTCARCITANRSRCTSAGTIGNCVEPAGPALCKYLRI